MLNSISGCFRDIGLSAYWGHELSCRGHVTLSIIVYYVQSVTSSVTWPFNSQ